MSAYLHILHKFWGGGLVIYIYTFIVLSVQLTGRNKYITFWQDQRVFLILVENVLSLKNENECSHHL